MNWKKFAAGLCAGALFASSATVATAAKQTYADCSFGAAACTAGGTAPISGGPPGLCTFSGAGTLNECDPTFFNYNCNGDVFDQCAGTYGVNNTPCTGPAPSCR